MKTPTETEKLTPNNDPTNRVDAIRAFAKILGKAVAGDKTTLPIVRRAFAEVPELIDEMGGDLAKASQESLVNAIAGEDLILQHAITGKISAMRRELMGPNPTMIEKLLVERVLACWLHQQHADSQHNHQTGQVTLAVADFQQRRMTHCSRRYLAALKALATVRKLALPAVQINIARKQMNQVNTGPVVDGEPPAPEKPQSAPMQLVTAESDKIAQTPDPLAAIPSPERNV